MFSFRSTSTSQKASAKQPGQTASRSLFRSSKTPPTTAPQYSASYAQPSVAPVPPQQYYRLSSRSPAVPLTSYRPSYNGPTVNQLTSSARTSKEAAPPSYNYSSTRSSAEKPVRSNSAPTPGVSEKNQVAQAHDEHRRHGEPPGLTIPTSGTKNEAPRSAYPTTSAAAVTQRAPDPPTRRPGEERQRKDSFTAFFGTGRGSLRGLLGKEKTPATAPQPVQPVPSPPSYDAAAPPLVPQPPTVVNYRSKKAQVADPSSSEDTQDSTSKSRTRKERAPPAPRIFAMILPSRDDVTFQGSNPVTPVNANPPTAHPHESRSRHSSSTTRPPTIAPGAPLKGSRLRAESNPFDYDQPTPPTAPSQPSSSQVVKPPSRRSSKQTLLPAPPRTSSSQSIDNSRQVALARPPAYEPAESSYPVALYKSKEVDHRRPAVPDFSNPPSGRAAIELTDSDNSTNVQIGTRGSPPRELVHAGAIGYAPETTRHTSLISVTATTAQVVAPRRGHTVPEQRSEAVGALTYRSEPESQAVVPMASSQATSRDERHRGDVTVITRRNHPSSSAERSSRKAAAIEPPPEPVAEIGYVTAPEQRSEATRALTYRSEPESQAVVPVASSQVVSREERHRGDTTRHNHASSREERSSRKAAAIEPPPAPVAAIGYAAVPEQRNEVAGALTYRSEAERQAVVPVAVSREERHRGDGSADIARRHHHQSTSAERSSRKAAAIEPPPVPVAAIGYATAPEQRGEAAGAITYRSEAESQAAVPVSSSQTASRRERPRGDVTTDVIRRKSSSREERSSRKAALIEPPPAPVAAIGYTDTYNALVPASSSQTQVSAPLERSSKRAPREERHPEPARIGYAEMSGALVPATSTQVVSSRVPSRNSLQAVSRSDEATSSGSEQPRSMVATVGPTDLVRRNQSSSLGWPSKGASHEAAAIQPPPPPSEPARIGYSDLSGAVVPVRPAQVVTRSSSQALVASRGDVISSGQEQPRSDVAAVGFPRSHTTTLERSSHATTREAAAIEHSSASAGRIGYTEASSAVVPGRSSHVASRSSAKSSHHHRSAISSGSEAVRSDVADVGPRNALERVSDSYRAREVAAIEQPPIPMAQLGYPESSGAIIPSSSSRAVSRSNPAAEHASTSSNAIEYREVTRHTILASVTSSEVATRPSRDSTSQSYSASSLTTQSYISSPMGDSMLTPSSLTSSLPSWEVAPPVSRHIPLTPYARPTEKLSKPKDRLTDYAASTLYDTSTASSSESASRSRKQQGALVKSTTVIASSSSSNAVREIKSGAQIPTPSPSGTDESSTGSNSKTQLQQGTLSIMPPPPPRQSSSSSHERRATLDSIKPPAPPPTSYHAAPPRRSSSDTPSSKGFPSLKFPQTRVPLTTPVTSPEVPAPTPYPLSQSDSESPGGQKLWSSRRSRAPAHLTAALSPGPSRTAMPTLSVSPTFPPTTTASSSSRHGYSSAPTSAYPSTSASSSSKTASMPPTTMPSTRSRTYSREGEVRARDSFEREKEKQRDAERERERDREKDRERGRERDRERAKEKERERERGHRRTPSPLIGSHGSKKYAAFAFLTRKKKQRTMSVASMETLGGSYFVGTESSIGHGDESRPPSPPAADPKVLVREWTDGLASLPKSLKVRKPGIVWDVQTKHPSPVASLPVLMARDEKGLGLNIF